MTEAQRETLQKLLRVAERDLDDLDLQVKRLETMVTNLRGRRRRYELVVHHARAALLAEHQDGLSNGVDGIDRPPTQATVNDQPLWMGAFEVLRDAEGPMTVGMITKELERRGRMLSRNGREVVRVAMVRRPDLFLRNDEGLYYVLPADHPMGTR